MSCGCESSAFKVRSLAPVDTSRRKIRHYAPALNRVREIVTFTGGTWPNEWNGASECITRFSFSLGQIALSYFPKPADPNYVLVIAWLDVATQTMVRYKLWEDVDEILFLPLYNGEAITNTERFFLEVWNTPEGSEIVIEDYQFKTTRLIIPSTLCDDSDIQSSISFSECIDPIFHFEDDAFNPLNGDYYIFDGPCLRIVVRGTVIFLPPLNILQSTDDTWHYVWMEEIDDQIFFTIDQTNAPEPVGALGYFPLIQRDADVVWKINLILMDDEGDPTHTLRYETDIPHQAGEANAFYILNEGDNLYYPLTIALGAEDELVLEVNQDGIPLP